MSNNFLTANLASLESMQPGDQAYGYDVNRIAAVLNGVNPIPLIIGNLTAAAITATSLTMLGSSVGAGTLGYAEVTANQGPFSVLTDITGLTVTISVGTGRRIEVSSYYNFNAVNATFVAYIYEGATVLQTSPTMSGGGVMSIILKPSGGAHTYKIAMNGTALTSTASATQPAYILVKDIGI